MYLTVLRFGLVIFAVSTQIGVSFARKHIIERVLEELNPTPGEQELKDLIKKNEELLQILNTERKTLRGAEQESVDHFISQTVKVTDEAKRVLMDDRIPREHKNLDAINPKDIYLQHLLERYYGLFINHEQPKKIGNRVFKNVRLVKRKVPIGYRGPRYEFDDDKKTMYKPLIKSMRQPRASLYDILIPNRKEPSSQEITQKEQHDINILSNAIAQFLIKYRSYWSNRDPLRMFGADGKGLINNHNKHYVDAFSMASLNTLQDVNEFEMRDPIMDSQAPNNVVWNSWTYHKEPLFLQTTHCPGMQILVNNICVKTPPHYRRLYGQ